MASQPIVNTYSLSNYTYGTKLPKMEKYFSFEDRMSHMKVSFKKEGRRNSVEGILVVHEHNHPHILLFQIGVSTYRKLPGGRLRPGENEVEGLIRKLNSKLAADAYPRNWQIGECVGIWWRPQFETLMFPYCPPHITKPKECKKLFIVHLPDREYFTVPSNLTPLAVPLFEMHDNAHKYGSVIANIPHHLSRFCFNMVRDT